MQTASNTTTGASTLQSIINRICMHFGLEASQPVVAAVVCLFLIFFITVPLELSQLTFALAGAMTYAGLQVLQSKAKTFDTKRSTKKLGTKVDPPSSYQGIRYSTARGSGDAIHYKQGMRQMHNNPRPKRMATPVISKAEVRKPSSQPVSAPVFRGIGWDAEVNELVAQIMPNDEGDRIVKSLADFVTERIKSFIPEAEVIGCVSGDLSRGTAFGVAVPEVDIVVNIAPHTLAQRLQGRFAKGSLSTMRLDRTKLQKSAIRACTDLLVADGAFKFRRSAFRGEEPKVTLLVPAAFGIAEDAIPIDFSVNSTTPLYNMALLTECGRKDMRAKALILLVKRWAKDRGVCHAAKGHLSPYPWSLLVIFFLQVGGASEEEQPMLPPVEEFEASSRLLADQSHQDKPKWSSRDSGSQKSVGTLFKEFVHFYRHTFDWRKEAVSVRIGKRAPPGLSLPIHIVMNEETSVTEVAPSIEDPFNPSRNLGVVMTAVSLARLNAEIARADDICNAEGSLTQLLEPWAPPEWAKDAEDDENEIASSVKIKKDSSPSSKLLRSAHGDSKAWGA